MIQVLENEYGFISAYIIYQVLDKNGQFQEGGEYLYIEELWIHPKSRLTSFNTEVDTLRKLINKVDRDKLTKNCQYVYWKNLKRGERQTRNYIRKRLSKLGENHGRKEKILTPCT